MKRYLIGKIADSGEFLPLRSEGFSHGDVLSVDLPRVSAFRRVACAFKAVHLLPDSILEECTSIKEVLHPDTVLTVLIEGTPVSAPAHLLCSIAAAYYARAKTETFESARIYYRRNANSVTDTLRDMGYFEW